MTVEPLSQHDQRWQGQRLGTRNGTTIGSHGCLITCITMMNRAFNPGDNRMPNNVDDIFTNEHGYLNNDGSGQTSPAAGCNMVLWGKIQGLLPNVGLMGVGYYSGPADINRINHHLDIGGLVVLKVFWKGNKNLPHYILAVAHQGDTIIVNDPETGQRQNFASKLFGSGDQVKDIYEAHFFGDAIPNVAVEPAPPAPAPAAPSNPEPGRGSVEPAPAPVIDPPKEEEVTQAAHDAIVAELNRVHQIQLEDEQRKTAAAIQVAETQGQTIIDLNKKLEANVPEYVRTEEPESGEFLTSAARDLIDFSDANPPVSSEANLIVTAHSSFIVAGLTYIRSEESFKKGLWYGYDVRFLAPYKPLTPGPIAAPAPTPLNSSQSLFATAMDGMSAWKKVLSKLKFWRTR